jgi:hypothetical protein
MEDGLAWLRGGIGLNELARQRGMRYSRNVLPRLAVYIREAYRKEQLSDR